MLDTPLSAAPLTHSVRWFTPWTWRRRWLVLIAVGMLVGYVLSAAPVTYLLLRTRMNERMPVLWQARNLFYWPLEAAWYYNEPSREFYSAEFRLMKSAFGPVRPTGK